MDNGKNQSKVTTIFVKNKHREHKKQSVDIYQENPLDGPNL